MSDPLNIYRYFARGGWKNECRTCRRLRQEAARVGAYLPVVGRGIAAQRALERRNTLPHCRECHITTGPDFIEKSLDAEGLCSDCAQRRDAAHLGGILCEGLPYTWPPLGRLGETSPSPLDTYAARV